MKEIKAKTVYLEEYDVNVNCYLTYAQIHGSKTSRWWRYLGGTSDQY